jgi:transmembrane sensor
MMAHDREPDLQTEAIGWRIRLRDGGADDWDAFVAWLENDPARSAAYDAIAAADEALRPEEVPALVLPANEDEFRPAARPARRRWAFAAGGLVAIVTAAAVLTPSERTPEST